jgi:tetratricopeptide (TPR) repeat protein
MELLGLAHAQLGLYYDHKSDLKSAERELAKAVEMHQRLSELYPRRSMHAVQLGHARGDLADFYVRHERPGEALAMLETSTAALLREHDHQGPPRDGRVHELLMYQYDELSRLLKEQGKTERAAEVARQSDELGPPPRRHPPGRQAREEPPQRPDDPPPRRIPRNDFNPPDGDRPRPESRPPRPEDHGPPDGRRPLEHGPPEHKPPRREAR